MKTSFDLAINRRHRILWRLDGGFGTDEKLTWLLARQQPGHQQRLFRLSHREFDGTSHALESIWGRVVALSLNYGREVRVWVKRRVEKDQFKHSYYLTTLHLRSLQAAMTLYDQRGGTEVELFRNDK